MNEQIKIRKIEIADIPKIVEIYNQALISSPFVQDNNPHTVEKRTKWYYQKQSEGLPIFVTVKNNNKVVGFARGLGIGKTLLEQLINWSKDNQKHTILAGIDAENIPSIRLHQSFGFTEVARFKEVIQKFGGYRDLNFYQLILHND